MTRATRRDVIGTLQGRVFLPCLICASLQAQVYTISTVAGGGPIVPTKTGALPSIPLPNWLAVDAAGNVYFSEGQGYNALSFVYRLAPDGTLSRVAGNGSVGFSGDGGPAVNAGLFSVAGGAVDAAGNLYLSDYGNNRVRRVTPGGIISTVAGNGTQGYSGDGGPATSARLNHPGGLAVDSSGNLYIADGKGSYIVGDHYVNGCNCVRQVTPQGIIRTVPLPAKASADNIAVGGAGSLYVAIPGGGSVIKLKDGNITVVTSQRGPIAADSLDNLYYFAAVGFGLFKLTPDGVVSLVAGKGKAYPGDEGPAADADVSFTNCLAVDGRGNVYLAENRIGPTRIRKITPDGIIHTVAGGATQSDPGDGGPATSARLQNPLAVVADKAGNLYIAEYDNRRVRKVTPEGTITTVAGNGTYGFSGDGGQATSAQISPEALALDNAGNLYICDVSQVGQNATERIRKVTPNGIIQTIAGGGSSLGDGVPATSVYLVFQGLAVDNAGNVYILDYGAVRKVTPQGIISTIAGKRGSGYDGATRKSLYSGDGGPATDAQFGSGPQGITLDSFGNLFVNDSGNCRIREVNTAGIINTVAGTGTCGYSGDGGQATSTQLGNPARAIAADDQGNLYIAELNPNGGGRVRKVTPQGIINTIAGNGTVGYSGDGGPGTGGQFLSPVSVAADGSGNVYVLDTSSPAATANVVRQLKPITQTVLVSAVLDAASESAIPVSPGKIVVIYGVGLGPASLSQNHSDGGVFGTETGGTTVSFNGIPAPVLYATASQVSAVVPYGIGSSSAAQVTVSFQGAVSPAFSVPVAAAAPSFFSANGTGAGQIAAVNADGTLNDASHPVRVGGYVSFYATGEGQTTPAGIDGRLASSAPYPAPVLPVRVKIGGAPATVAYAGAAPTLVAGLMQIVVQIPQGIQAGGYVPVVLSVGDASSVDGAAWIAIAGN